MFQLRPYQQDAVHAVVNYFRRRSDPAVLVLPTGAGKSLVIAELARLARGRVLVLAHVKELVEQNHAKYEAYGHRADIFAAGLKRKEAEQQVVFGSVQSVARNLDRFAGDFTLLVIDECHRVSLEENSEYQRIIRHFREHNTALKVLGLTATPYRLGQGWIYRFHYHGMVRGDETCLFRDCIYELPLRLMVRQGYLTPPELVDAPVAQYDFSALQPGPNGRYREDELNRVVQGAGRATAQIIDQVLAYARTRQGVMIFAATVAHAREILGYLPADEAALVVGDTGQQERDALITAFKQQQLKYLVNVSVLTTGFDAPHVDLIAILRPTESVSLYQQIIGRGLRLSPGKTDCLVLDYAGNTYDIYAPEVGASKPDPDSEPVMVFCPQCGFANTFWGKLDSDGQLIEHYGRKCQGFAEVDGERQLCDYRFRFKECDQCGAQNDIAARQCQHCGDMLVDPDKKLREALQLKDAMVLRCAGMTLHEHRGKQGQSQLRVIYHDEEGTELSEFFALETPAQRGAFSHHFVRHHLRDPGSHFSVKDVASVMAAQARFRSPDFVIARRQGRFWRVRDKVFDYEGRFRRANELKAS